MVDIIDDIIHAKDTSEHYLVRYGFDLVDYKSNRIWSEGYNVFKNIESLERKDKDLIYEIQIVISKEENGKILDAHFSGKIKLKRSPKIKLNIEKAERSFWIFRKKTIDDYFLINDKSILSEEVQRILMSFRYENIRIITKDKSIDFEFIINSLNNDSYDRIMIILNFLGSIS